MVSGWLCRSRCQDGSSSNSCHRNQITHKFLMGVVAGHASDPSVAFRSPASALFQAVRLGPNVGDPHKTGKFDVPPSAVAGTTEVNGINRVELGGIEDRACFLPGFAPRLRD